MGDVAAGLVARMRPFGTTVFAEMSALAVRTGAVNLGQGYPDFDGPQAMLDAAAYAIGHGHNQYPPGLGIEALRTAIAAHQQRFWGLAYDVGTEVVVTAGATEAITAAVLALCEPGDEVVCLDPLYDSYAAAVALAGAVLRPVAPRPDATGRFGFDNEEFRGAFGPRTRLLLLNSPHNPTGTVLTAAEIDVVAAVCLEFDVVAVSDEVYEHLVLDGTHVPLAARAGMRERTVVVSSAGKTFSCTGWKIGWACGPAPLISALTRVKQYLTYANGGPFQPAVAVALGLGDAYFEDLVSSMTRRRDHLSAGLRAAGFDVMVSQGTYFVVADIRPLGGEDGLAFCRDLPARCGVVAVPMQVFHTQPERGRHLIRFTFGKTDRMIAAGVERLQGLRSGR